MLQLSSLASRKNQLLIPSQDHRLLPLLVEIQPTQLFSDLKPWRGDQSSLHLGNHLSHFYQGIQIQGFTLKLNHHLGFYSRGFPNGRRSSRYRVKSQPRQEDEQRHQIRTKSRPSAGPVGFTSQCNLNQVLGHRKLPNQHSRIKSINSAIQIQL